MPGVAVVMAEAVDTAVAAMRQAMLAEKDIVRHMKV
ncbi:hypothetical protein [Burkholderia phage FLC9]|nr:hypothetical protein [Burkholderia phage FLC9]